MNSISDLDSYPFSEVHLRVVEDDVREISEEGRTDVEFFIRQAFQSDPQLGCELLYRSYFQPLCSHAVRFLYSKSIAEDLVSDIFYQFYLKETYREITTSYRGYLYKTVRHRAYNYLQRESKRMTGLDIAENFSDEVSGQPDSITQYEELYQDIEKVISNLPNQQRKIYLLYRFEGKKYAEIAEQLQLSLRTIEVQIRKANHTIRDILKMKGIIMVNGLIHLGLSIL